MTLTSFLHILKWFQVLLYKSNLTAVIYLHTVCSIWPIDRTLSSATTPSGRWSNNNQWVLHIPEISRAGASPSENLMSYLGHSLGEVLPLCRNAVGVYYNPNWLGSEMKGYSTLPDLQNWSLAFKCSPGSYPEHPHFFWRGG